MIKQFFKDTPNSVFFWNGLVLLSFILLYIIGEDITMGMIVMINIPAFFMILINLEDSRYNSSKKVIGYHYWIYLAPITWVLILIGLIIGGVVWIIIQGSEYSKHFNNWLNKK